MMSDVEHQDEPEADPPQRRMRPFQFDIRALLILTALLSVLLAVLRWLELTPEAMLLVLGISGFSAVAGAGLVIALTMAMGRGRKG